MTLSLDFASFIHAPKKVALRLAIFAALSLIATFGVMRWSAKGAFGITSAPIPQVTFTTSLQLAYYNQDNEWDSTVVLNNNAKDERFISITLYGKDGQPLNVPVFSIPANSIKRFKIIDWTLGANNFREGNINVAFNGKPMEITGQVSVVNSHDRLEFESKPSMPMDYSSKRLNGIVTLPERQAKAYVALTNTSSNPIEVSLTSDAEHVHADKVNLSAHETKVEEIKMKNGNNSPLSALVTLTHNGVVSALITTAYAINKQTGFTSNLYFYDDAKTVSNRLAGVHFRFGDANPTEGFPAGTVFKAPLVLANLGTAATTATVTVDYTKNGQAKLQSIGSFLVPSRGVKEIELQSALAALGVTGPVDNAGVDIRYTGTTGTLIGQLTSASTSGDYSFDVPMKDPLISMNRTSGSYPFRLDGNYNTVLHLKNMSDKKVRAVVQVRYEGGTYHPEQLNLEPFQTVAVDIKKFKSQQTLDIRGNVFPVNVTSGKIIWTERDVASVIGRAETINLSGGIAGSFSCPWCSCPPHHGYFSMEYISPFNGFSVVGDAGYSLRGWEHLISCDEIEAWGPYWVSGYALNWSSSNAGVASIGADGWVQCLTPGWTSIGGSYLTMIATDNNSPNCDETYAIVDSAAPVTVNPAVTIDSNFLAVGKGFTVPVAVTLNPSPSQVPVTLTITTNNGTGAAQFASNNSTSLSVSSSSNVVIKGITESNTANNMRLEAKAGNTVLATKNFTVVKVELALRTSGTLSTDNAARSEYNADLGTYNLGTVYSTGNGQGWSTGVEIVGTVTPSNFTGGITLDRVKLISRFWENTTNYITETNEPDLSPPIYRDDDPQPNGKVYDEDAPSVSVANPIIGRIVRRRTSFTQWARIGNARVSADFDWFCRLSITYAGSGVWNLVNDVNGDNIAGEGITKTSINLQ